MIEAPHSSCPRSPASAELRARGRERGVRSLKLLPRGASGTGAWRGTSAKRSIDSASREPVVPVSKTMDIHERIDRVVVRAHHVPRRFQRRALVGMIPLPARPMPIDFAVMHVEHWASRCQFHRAHDAPQRPVSRVVKAKLKLARESVVVGLGVHFPNDSGSGHLALNVVLGKPPHPRVRVGPIQDPPGELPGGPVPVGYRDA